MDHERRTVLIDLDLANPSLHQRFHLAAGPGIHDIVDGPSNVEDYLQRIVGDVWLLSAGPAQHEIPRVLSRFAGGPILSQLSEWADTIVFDLPPLLGSAAGIEATRLCETPVLVVRAGVTPIPLVKEAVELLATPPPVVLNGVRSGPGHKPVIWPLLGLLGLFAVALRWHNRPQRAQAVAVVVTAVVLGYAWLGLGKL
jgi:Mrp family chromosome partitioning ATPase